MNLKEELILTARKFLGEGIDSSKEMIATNSVDCDEMGMATNAPGEFSEDEITDRENLVNTARLSNDNEKGDDTEIVMNTTALEAPNLDSIVRDLLNLGGDEEDSLEDTPTVHSMHGSRFAARMESVLKGRTFAEILMESDLEEATVDDWPGFVPAQPGGIGKWVNALMSRLSANASAIKRGDIQIPDNIKKNWQYYVNIYKQYNISQIGSPVFLKILRAVAAKSGNPEFIDNPTEQDCEAFGTALNAALRNKGGADIDFEFEPGMSLAQTADKSSKNYQVRAAFQKAYTDALASTVNRGGHYGTINQFNSSFAPAEEEPVVATPIEEPAVPEMSDEDLALLQSHGISATNPEAAQILSLLKTMSLSKKPKRIKREEGVLAESDFAGPTKFNPDHRIGSSEVLAALKNAIDDKAIAAKLSITVDVDADEMPTYRVLNAEEKDLPATLEIDMKTAEPIVLKKDGNSYKVSK